jgi:peptidyl-prolyl cis-trans isomerase SurA
MKYFLGLFTTVVISMNAHAQTLIIYGTNTVSKDEFLRAYNKNKSLENNKEKAINDYVELFTNFKLKVKAAQELRVDTSEQIKNDVENFRRQIIENYLTDEKTFNTLMTQAFQRSQEDLHVIRYSVPIDENMSPEDSLKKFQSVQKLFNQLKANGSSTSGDDVKKVDMGFITVFSLPYQYENIVYGLETGNVAAPFKAKKFWHIFKVTERRKSAGKWKIAQILFTSPYNADEATKKRARHLADSVYSLLQKGATFATLAKTFSDDKLTYLNGGEMPEFGTGKFDASFEKEVVSLKKDEEFSAPFATEFGIHIIKRISYTPTATDPKDEALQFELKQKLMQDGRIQIAKDIFSKEIVTKIGFKQLTTIKKEDLYRYVDTVMLNLEDAYSTSNTPISKQNIFSCNKGNIKGEDWLNFARDYKSNPELYNEESNATLFEKYKTIAAIEFYKKHLEDYNADFAYQMQEFKEGNMLFDIMDKKVWANAAADTVGLLAYYNSNKDHYLWAPSADVIIINCASETLANELLTSLKNGLSWKEIVDAKPEELQGDSGRFELTQINGNASAMPGSYAAVSKNADGTATIMKYIKLYPDGEQRNFQDAKGMVINDYQNVVEKRWIEELRKKYPVKINEKVLQEIMKK